MTASSPYFAKYERSGNATQNARSPLAIASKSAFSPGRCGNVQISRIALGQVTQRLTVTVFVDIYNQPTCVNQWEEIRRCYVPTKLAEHFEDASDRGIPNDFLNEALSVIVS